MSGNRLNLNLSKGHPFTADEVEFIAEEQLIEIYPAFTYPHTITGIDGGEYGPFNMHTPCNVPIHMAITLKKAKQCRIVPPAWFTVTNLTQLFQQETQEPGALQPIPYHYLEIGHMLLTHARDDLDRPERLRECLKDVEDVRRNKLFALVRPQNEPRDVVLLTGASLMELQAVRGALVDIFNDLSEVEQLSRQQ